VSGAAVNIQVFGGAGSGQVSGSLTDSAKSLSDKLNSLSQTGVKFSAKTETVLTFSGAAAGTTSGGSYTLQVTGSNTNAYETITFQISANNTAAGLSDAVTAFNNASTKTGITAKLNATNDGIVLTQSEGYNIGIGATAGTGIVALSGATGARLSSGGISGLVAAGQLTIDSDKAYSLSVSGAGAAAASVTAGVFSGAGAIGSTTAGTLVQSSLQTVTSLDISTADNATKALRIVDSALSRVNSQRASFGALQSRFEATVANLQATSENLSAARSRIRDADFATETANMTRAQILQQAGVSMLAQANALPNNVLTLLR
jgi:flagellin